MSCAWGGPPSIPLPFHLSSLFFLTLSSFIPIINVIISILVFPSHSCFLVAAVRCPALVSPSIILSAGEEGPSKGESRLKLRAGLQCIPVQRMQPASRGRFGFGGFQPHSLLWSLIFVSHGLEFKNCNYLLDGGKRGLDV